MDTTSEEHKEPIQTNQSFILEGFPRKKLSSGSEAHKKYFRAILEASAELTRVFQTEYLERVINGSIKPEILNSDNSVGSYDTLKKGFLYYLNGSGKYLVLREHLRGAVTSILHQKSLVNHAYGFQTKQQFQNFLHDSYCYLLDVMNQALYSTSFNESLLVGITKCGVPGADGIHKELRKARHIREFLLFAQEAFAQSDFDNAHRLFVERIARSGDSDDCWIDFAKMWLSRGDDRLAEIAVREALSKNPDNLIGLLLAGLICGSHREEQGIRHLEKLLKHRPLCPEIHILLGLVNNQIGNKKAAEIHFDTAHKLHHILTGRIPPRVPAVPKEEELPPTSAPSPPEEPPKSDGGAGDKKNKKNKKKGETIEKKKSSQLTVSRKESLISEMSKKTYGSLVVEKNSKKRDSRSSIHYLEKESLLSGKLSEPEDIKSIPEMYEDGQKSQSEEELGIKITRDNFHSTKPPKLGSCILVTWNVTKKKREKGHPEFGHNNQYIPAIGETPEEVHGQFNLVLDIDAGNRKTMMAEILGEDEYEYEMEGEYEEGDDVPRPPSFWQQKTQKRHRHHRHHKHPPIEIPHQHSSDSQHESDVPVVPLQPTTSEYKIDQPAENGAASVKEGEPVQSQRFGSELLWTAHLLLKLRQFEFFDLVLAMEISKSENRSVEYLYLRASSLHLRGRDQEALEIINEALTLEPDNGNLWTLRGHIHYNLRENDLALASYERTMMLPQGRESLHLVYLRIGALCAERGDLQLAKRIFLKRVTTYPSPYLWIALGSACYQLDELDEALHSFSEGNKMDNSNPTIWAYLSLVSLCQGNKNLAEQSYKWAIRFGLNNGKLLDEIKNLHVKLGYGNPAFPRIPHCVPHDVFVKRIGRETPLDIYADALNFSHLNRQRNKFENRESEDALINKLIARDAHREKNAAEASARPSEAELEGTASENEEEQQSKVS